MNWQTIILSLVFISYCAFSNTESVQGAQQNQSQKATRVWSDDSGTFKIEAELIKINQSSVTIKKLNGVVIDVPFARLSTTDRNFIQGQLQPATAPKKTTPPIVTTPTQPQTQPRLQTQPQPRTQTQPQPQTQPRPQTQPQPLTNLASNRQPTQPRTTETLPNNTSPQPLRSNSAAPTATTRSETPAYSNNAASSNNAVSSKPPSSNFDRDKMTFPKPNLNYRENPGANSSFGDPIPKDEIPKLAKIEFGSRSSTAQGNPNSDSYFPEIPKTTPRKSGLSKGTGLVFNVPANVLQLIPANVKPSVDLIMNASDHKGVRKGIRQLTNAQPRTAIPAVIEVIRQCSASRDSATRRMVIEYLTEVDSANSLNLIFGGINDSNFDVRWAAYRSLEKIGDQRVIPELAKRFPGEDRSQIMLVLNKLGSASEPHVIPHLSDESAKVQLSACSLLGQIGTAKSIARLKEVATTSTDAKVRLQANNSIKTIQARATGVANSNSFRTGNQIR